MLIKHEQIVYLSLILLFTGYMTLEAPSGTYALSTDGLNETASSDVNSIIETTETIKSESNWSKATGYCYRHGLKVDPVPWTSITLIINKDIDLVYLKNNA